MCHACGHDVHTTVVLGVLHRAGLARRPPRHRARPSSSRRRRPSPAVPPRSSPPVCWTAPRGRSRCTATPRCRSGTIGLRTGAITAACDRIDVTLHRPRRAHRPPAAHRRPGRRPRPADHRPARRCCPGRSTRGRDVAGVGRGQRRASRPTPSRSAASCAAPSGCSTGRLWKDAEELHALARRAGRGHHRRRGATSTTSAACRRWSTTRARSPCMRAAALETVGSDHVVLSPQSMGGEDFGWFAEVMPIALARLGTHGGGRAAGPAPGHLRRRRAGDRRRRPAAWRAPRCTRWRPTRAPARTGTRPRPETLQPDRPSTRGANPTTEFRQTADRDRPRRRGRCRPSTRCPTTSRSPREFPAATREQWRDLVAGVLRKAGRRGAARPGRGRAAQHGRHRRRRRAALHRRGRRRPARAVGRPRAPAVRPRRPRRCADPAAACRAAGTSGSGTPTPIPPSPKEAIAADLENGVTSLWLVLGEGAIPVDALGDVLSDVLLDLAPVTVAGRPRRPPRRSSPWCEGRTDLAPGSSLGLDPLGLQAATGEQQDLVRPGRRRPPGRRPRRSADASSSTRPSSPTPAPRPSRSSAARSPPGVAYLRALTEGGLERRRGVRPARVPLRRHRRPVHDDRRAARRPPAVGPGRRGQRGVAGGARPAAARGHLVGDDDEARPVGEPAAHDGRLLRRGRGRRRRRHGAAVRRRAGPARRLLPPDRPQHAEPAGRGGPPRPRARPGRRLLVRRVADRRARPGGLGLVHRDRAGRRPGRGAGLRPGRATGSPPPGRGARRAAGAPRRTRSPASASSPTWPRSCPSATPAAEAAADRRAAAGCAPREAFEELRDARPRRRRRGLPRHDRRRSPGTPPARASPATCSRPAGSRRRPATAPTASPRRGRRWPASAAPTRTTRRGRGAGRGAEGGRRHPGVAGRQAGPRRRRRRRVRLRRVRRPRRPAHRARRAGS